MVWKARAGGTAEVVWWASLDPVESGTTPALAISDSTAPAMAALFAEGSVTAIASDLRTLTVSLALGVKGIPSRGEAWLLTDEDGAFPVHVGRAVGTTVTLTEALPRAIDLSGSAVLQSAWWHATLDAATTATAERNLTWAVEYITSHGDFPSEPKRDEGLLHVVRQPFRTGLNHARLVALIPELSQMTHRRSQSLDPLIALAQGSLITVIRGELHERGLWEDDCDGRQLQLAHAYLTAGLVIEAQDAERGDALVLRGKRLAIEYMRSIWVDADRDGEVDDGEDNSQSRAGDVGSSQTSSHTFVFSVGMDH